MMDFQTPDHVCQYMTSFVPDELQWNILEPTPGEGNLVKALWNKGTVDTPDDFFTHQFQPYYDFIVMNPPFSPMTLGYEILYKCMEMTENIIALMPWLTLINGEKRLSRIMDFGLVSITHLNRNTFKGSRVQTCILYMHKHHRGQTIFKRLIS